MHKLFDPGWRDADLERKPAALAVVAGEDLAVLVQPMEGGSILRRDLDA